MSTQTSHDALFKQFLTHGDIAKDFFKLHLQPTLRDTYYFDTLRLESSSFIEPDLRACYSDILYSVKTARGDSYIYTLLEHQSTPDKLVAFQMMRNCIAVMDKHLRDGHERLPAVVPLLVYRGNANPYPCRTNWLELFDQPEIAAQLYAHTVPFIDITALSDENIFNHKWFAIFEFVQKHLDLSNPPELAKAVANTKGCLAHILDSVESLLTHLLQDMGTSRVAVLSESLAPNALSDEQSAITMARQIELRGYITGYIQGYIEGSTTGLREGAVIVARAMLESGMDKATILHLTRLDEAGLDQS